MSYMIKKNDKNNYQLSFQENIFTEKKHFYSDKIINYKDSPTGRAYIGFTS